MKTKKKLSIKKLQEKLDNYVMEDETLSSLIDVDLLGEESEIDTTDYTCQYSFIKGYCKVKINAYTGKIESVKYFTYDDKEVERVDELESADLE